MSLLTLSFIKFVEMQSFSLGWVTDTRYDIGGSIVTQRFRGMLLGEFKRVCPRTMVDVVG